jgi:hypothetical protein
MKALPDPDLRYFSKLKAVYYFRSPLTGKSRRSRALARRRRDRRDSNSQPLP